MMTSFYFYHAMRKWIIPGFIAIAVLSFIITECTTADLSHSGGLKEMIPSYVQDTIYLAPEDEFSTTKAELGHYLFYDRRLSVNNTKACASCHAQEFSFTDGYTRSIGALGDLHQRNSRPLINIIFNRYLTSADSSLHFPEQQIDNPMMNERPQEMGIKDHENEILLKLKEDGLYRNKFEKAFPGQKDPFTIKNIQWAICSFVKSIFSFQSPYDHYTYGHNKTALNDAQLKGMQLFFSDSLHCNSCHGGINFSNPSIKDSDGNKLSYFNTGLYCIDPDGAYPGYDRGLEMLTGNAGDMGKYRVPTLRNLAFTAPYYHDGSAATLQDVIAVYEDGGRHIAMGSYAGDGRKNPYKHSLIKGFRLNSEERRNLIAFLLSLSDSSICTNPGYSNPFSDDETKRQHASK
jgi:cytochrome c peroxidase